MNKNINAVLLASIIFLALISCGEISTYSGPNITPRGGDTGGINTNTPPSSGGDVIVTTIFSDHTIGINKKDKSLGSSAFFAARLKRYTTPINNVDISMLSVEKTIANTSSLYLDTSDFTYTKGTGELTLSESGLSKIKNVNLSDGKVYSYNINFTIKYEDTNSVIKSSSIELIEGEPIPESYIDSLMKSLGEISIQNSKWYGEAVFDFSSVGSISGSSPNYTVQASSSSAGEYLTRSTTLQIKMGLRKAIDDNQYLSDFHSFFPVIDENNNSITIYCGYTTKRGYIMPKSVSPGGISVKLILVDSQSKWVNNM